MKVLLNLTGDTAVTATVLGPVEVKMHNLNIDKTYVEVFYRCKSGMPSVVDRQREKMIRNTCEVAMLTVLYPRSAVTLQIHEMEDCGGVRKLSYLHSAPSFAQNSEHFVFAVGRVRRERCLLSTTEQWPRHEDADRWCSLHH